MTSATQSRFAEALLDRTKPVPQGLISWTGASPQKRYGVYRNNVATGLARALAARFPITEKIVGEEFFTAMAREFVLSHPPSSPVLLHYGEDFAGFVAEFAPAKSLPYLADIVRLENAQAMAGGRGEWMEKRLRFASISVFPKRQISARVDQCDGLTKIMLKAHENRISLQGGNASRGWVMMGQLWRR